MSVRAWKISAPEKLVGFLQRKVGGSGKAIRRILEANGCRVNGRIERFGSSSLNRGDWVEFCPLEKKEEKIVTLFETESLLIVNKPLGWVCHETVCRKTFGPNHFLVHRLDKDTTGALLIAKSPSVRDFLIAQFAARTVQKEYLALVDGKVREEEGSRESHLAKKKSFEGQTIFGSAPQGAYARTDWKCLARGETASLIACFPLTGRTHQIRVHLAEMGHPILGDRQYASHFRTPLFVPRPLLHAHCLSFQFEEAPIAVKAPLPDDFTAALHSLELSLCTS